MRKKVWVNAGDIVLLSLRDFQNEKADVIMKYTVEEARNLKVYGELPENTRINETDTIEGEGDDGVEFEEDTGVDIENVSNVMTHSSTIVTSVCRSDGVLPLFVY